MKDVPTAQLLCWSGMTDIEHTVCSTTSSSNVEEASIVLNLFLIYNQNTLCQFVLAQLGAAVVRE